MSTTNISVTGKVKWFRMRPGQENKWGKLSVNFYPEGDANRKLITSLKLKNGMKEDEDGVFFQFYTTPDKSPDIIGVPAGVLIGNGSTVEMKLEVYSWDNEHGKGFAARPISFTLKKLVEYKPAAKVETNDHVALPV